jgi:hypothetical protein
MAGSAAQGASSKAPASPWDVGVQDVTDLATEIATEVRLLRAIDAEPATHAAERETCNRWVDPIQLARSLPGLAEVGGPAMTAVIGNAARFPTAAHFKSPRGLAPRASETGDIDRKGQPMSKAGLPAGPRDADPGRGLGPQTRPPTRPGLPPADGRTRR